MQASGSSSTTTLTLTASPASTARTGGLWLMWLFPRPDDPALSLEMSSVNELIVGRDEACSLRVAGGDISRRHARVHRTGSGIVLSDLQSHNGTFVNGRRAKSTPLGPGDVVRFGGSVALVTDRLGAPREIGPGLLGGPRLQADLEPLMRVAASDLPVILVGETGTGKEVVARALHHWSGRGGPFVAVNCAALPEGLAESELFGHRRGAFTGAERSSPGFFRSAHGGTLLLDEVTDLPLVIQAKLLRVLEQHEVQPLGESEPQPIDVRIAVAAQGSLAEAADKGEFRQDLLARLDGLTVRLPPLRERVGDVPMLFLRASAELDAGRAPALEAEFVERLCMHDWPFNVREVVLLAKRLRALAGERATLRVGDLPPRMRGQEQDPAPEAGPVDLPALTTAIRVSEGNIAQAAAMLGISRQRAYRMLRSQAIDPEALRDENRGRQGRGEDG